MKVRNCEKETENSSDIPNDFEDVLPMKTALCSSVPSKVPIFNVEVLSAKASAKMSRYSGIQTPKLEPVDNGNKDWSTVLIEPSLVLYRRKPEVGDTSSFDTYQIRATVEGISAKELCMYFWDPQFRMDWEAAIDTPPTVLLQTDADSVVLHQFFTTIWPVKHRHSIFWSTNRSLPKSSPKSLSKHCVVNYSANYPLADDVLNKAASKMVFAFLDVILMCETVSKETSSASGDSHSITRQSLITEVAYICRIDPGGWIPSSLASMTSKSEYPRFLKRLVQYAKEKNANCPVDL